MKRQFFKHLFRYALQPNLALAYSVDPLCCQPSKHDVEYTVGLKTCQPTFVHNSGIWAISKVLSLLNSARNMQHY